MAFSRSLAFRLSAGGLLTLAATAAFAWVLVFASVEYRFNLLPPVPEERDATLRNLSQYSLTLDRLVREDPTNGVIRKRYASILALQKDYDRALEQLDKAQITNNTPDSLFFMADMADKHGRLQDAIDRMAQAVLLNPGNLQYNDAYLRLLNQRLEMLQRELRRRNQPLESNSELMRYKRDFAIASRNWAIRAPGDKNSYLFLGNHYVGPPLYPLQAYRCFLLGLSNAPWMTQVQKFMIEPRDVLGTVRQILNGWAKPYMGLTFGAAQPAQRPPAQRPSAKL